MGLGKNIIEIMAGEGYYGKGKREHRGWGNTSIEPGRDELIRRKQEIDSLLFEKMRHSFIIFRKNLEHVKSSNRVSIMDVSSSQHMLEFFNQFIRILFTLEFSQFLEPGLFPCLLKIATSFQSQRLSLLNLETFKNIIYALGLFQQIKGLLSQQYADHVQNILPHYQENIGKLTTYKTLLLNMSLSLSAPNLKEIESVLQHLQGYGDKFTVKHEMVRTLDVNQVHWYEYSNGHPYIIIECGDSTQESHDPEFNLLIDIAQHRVNEGRRLAKYTSGIQQPTYNVQHYDEKTRRSPELFDIEAQEFEYTFDSDED